MRWNRFLEHLSIKPFRSGEAQYLKQIYWNKLLESRETITQTIKQYPELYSRCVVVSDWFNRMLYGQSAQITSPATSISQMTSQIPFMITVAMKKQLKALGWTVEQISLLTPLEASKIIANKMNPEEYFSLESRKPTDDKDKE